MDREALYINESKKTLARIGEKFTQGNLTVITKPLKMTAIGTNLSEDIQLNDITGLNTVEGVTTLIKSTTILVNDKNLVPEGTTMLDTVSRLTDLVSSINGQKNVIK